MLLSNVVGRTRHSQRQPGAFIFIHVFIYLLCQLFSLVNWVNLIKMWFWQNKANTCIISSIQEAARCCRALLEGPVHPSLLPSLEKKHVIVACSCCIDIRFKIIKLYIIWKNYNPFISQYYVVLLKHILNFELLKLFYPLFIISHFMDIIKKMMLIQ